MLEVHTCKFVLASDLFEKHRDFLDLLSELEGFPYDDSSHTLISVKTLSEIIQDLTDEGLIEKTYSAKLLESLQEVEKEAAYIDFEN